LKKEGRRCSRCLSIVTSSPCLLEISTLGNAIKNKIMKGFEKN